MSFQSVALSLTNETKEVFDTMLKVAISKSNEQEHDERATTLNDKLLVNNEMDNESNKSFLLKKFLLNSSENVNMERELIDEMGRPIPKPRKCKNLSQKLQHISPANSASSQKTYTVENAETNYIHTVDVTVHHGQMLSVRSKKKSIDLDKTSAKSVNSGKEISYHPNDTLNERLTGTDNNSSSSESKNKPPKNKSVEDNKDLVSNIHKYEKIVEIIIHKTNALQIDSYVIHPTVKVHIVDINTGKYYLKSNKNRPVVFYYENEEQDYILPVMTSPYNLQEERTFSPEWEESILLNEDFNHLVNENVMIFFEVLDYVPFISKNFHKLQKYCHKGWHRITFAYMKPVGKEWLNINKKVKLQLYYPKEFKKNRDPSKCDLWYIWKANKLEKYPSALYVTVNEVNPPKMVTEALRSKTPLEKESISNLRNCKPSSRNDKVTVEKEVLSKLKHNDSKKPFELQNKPLAELDSYDKGCLILKFSNSGLYLASAVYVKGTYTVVVYSVNSLEEVYNANEHRGLIYSINWSLDDSLLITASADGTVMIWRFFTQSFLQILPHPIYVYSTHISNDNTTIATGCYDTIVRIWFYNEQEKKYELHQELEKHEGYVTSVCFNNKSTNLYSADSTGCIMKWSRLDNSDWQFERDISAPDLKNTVINEIILFPKDKKMLVHSRDSILRIISIKRNCVLYWLQGALNFRIQTFCSITSCGNYVTSGSENGLVIVWDARTGKDIMSYEPFLNHFDLEAVHCARFHPKNNLIAFSHYGSVCPILLYEYTETEENGILKNAQYFLDKSENNSLHEKSREKEANCFHDVLDKMDKLLNL